MTPVAAITTEAPTLHPLLAERWSPRAFDPTSVIDAAQVEVLLEAARWAPSAANLQPWRFVVGVRGSETFAAIFATLMPGNQLWAGDAAALVVAVARTSDDDGTALSHAGYDLGQAVAHLSIQAQSDGWHVHQMAGFDVSALAEALNVPNGYAPMVVVAVGTLGDPERLPQPLRDRESAPRQRQPLQEIAFTTTWGNPIVDLPVSA